MNAVRCFFLLLSNIYFLFFIHRLSFAGSAEPPPCKPLGMIGVTGVSCHGLNSCDDNCDPKCDGADSMRNTGETNKENVPLNNQTKLQWNISSALNSDSTEDDDTIVRDYDQFNPFRFYYISPDLPLDTELVQAAIAESEERQPIDTTDEVEEKQEREEEEHRSSEDLVTLPRPVVWFNKKCSSPTSVERRREKCSEKLKDRIKCESPETTSELFNETADVDNLWFDDFVLGTSACASQVDQSAESGQTIVPQFLIDFFVSMADPRAISIGNEISHHCAFSFPAVALTLGRENWPLLKQAYEELADAREYRVRRTMASSIHELARILGEELAGRDLVPIYDLIIKDLDEVRIGALKHLSSFLKVLSRQDRYLLLPRLVSFITVETDRNWRFREEVASRLLETVELFSPKNVSEHIAPLSLPLLVDKVAAVRHMALALVSERVFL